MRVAMYYENQDVRLEELPTPKISAGEILVKVNASGICGSDVLEWYRKKRAPLVLGHEISAEIVEVGDGVKGYKVGDRIFVSHHIPCNTCRFCLSGHHTACNTLQKTNFDPGGFAEFVRIPKLNVDRGVFPIPDAVTDDEVTFIEPLGCVVRGQRSANLRPGQTVLVLGSGISGILHIALARAAGAARIIATDINDFRLEAARKLGADETIHAEDNVPEKLKSFNQGRLADLVIVCTGSPLALRQAMESADRGGTIEFFATSEPGRDLSVPLNEFWRNAMTLKTSYGAAPYDLSVALDLIRGGRIPVKDMITHRLGLEEAGKGFQLVAEAEKSIKVILYPHR